MEQQECRSIVEGFLDLLGALIERSLRGARPVFITDVLELAEAYVRHRGGCYGVGTSLENEYRAIGKLALDFAMEALSRHMERLDEETYSMLSGVMTSYALHVIRLSAVLLEKALSFGGFPEIVMIAAEPLLFASAARLYALSRLLRRMETQEVKEAAPRIKLLVDFFIAEETNFLGKLLERLSQGDISE